MPQLGVSRLRQCLSGLNDLSQFSFLASIAPFRLRQSFRYNLIWMELLFNLAWLAVALGLVAVWFAVSRSSRRVPNADWKIQAVAIAVLIFVLLPIISLTDDVQALTRDQQAWTTPPEVKRALQACIHAYGMQAAVQNLDLLWMHALLTNSVVRPDVSRDRAFPPKFLSPQLVSTKPIESQPPPRSLA